MSSSVGVFQKPLNCEPYQHVDNGGSAEAGKLARAYDETGVGLPAASCKFGALVQAIVDNAGKFIYIKLSNTKTAPTSATDYSLRLADGVFAWSDDTSSATMLTVVRFD